jgi:hypothetical protein
MATGFTLLRQDEDIRKSDSYDDSVAPTEAAYETNPADIEDDLNNVRSAINNLLNRDGASFPTADWFDDLAAPTALETGTARGIQATNDALHLLEKKRVLKCLWTLNSISIALAGDTFDILGGTELPGNTQARVGASTDLGTVTADNSGGFGAHSLAEVSGTSALRPKNLVQIVDAVTRDPVLDAGDKIYGLLQSESATDHTITATTPNRVQISFVKINGAGNDLIAITSGAMDGVSYDYCYVERVRFEDLTEEDWLGNAEIDVPAGATVTRQSAYDGQGVTVVDTTTNATLDLGTGLFWEIGDDDSLTMLRATEGSAGGTSTLLVGTGVDVFDVDAVDNDFLNGATFGTTGTGIQVAETAGLIERAADLTLYASGSGELFLHDSNINSEGTWAQAGVKLTETTTEVSDYETAFGGEVSLFNAIVQAYNAGADPVRSFHVVNTTITANNDVSGPAGASNVDVNFPDLSTGTFTDNHWLFLNGRLMRPGADLNADFDYYPGTALTPDADLRFERVLRSGDVIVIVYWP